MKRIRSCAGLVICLAIWQLVSPFNSVLVPPIDAIAKEYMALIDSGIIQRDIVASVYRVLVGVLLSTTIACLLGLVSSYWQQFPDYISGIVEIVRPVPPIAWTPIAIIAFGIGSSPAIAIVIIGSIFPIWLSIQQGIDEVNESHIRAAKSLGARHWLVFTDVIFPTVLPYFMQGLRLGVALGWFCVVAAEMVGATGGLGYGIQLYSLNIEMEKVYSYILTIGALGLISNAVLVFTNSRIIRWKEND